ncbi:MAG: FAD-dependent oxidoreductase, partial [Promethearchaeota archaeon]
IIVGCGPAGIACAIQLKRSNIDFKIICNKFGGIANNANKIENLLGFPKGIYGKSFVALLKQHFETLSIEFTKDNIQNISKENENDIFHIKCENGEFYSKNLIIASGTVPKKLNLPGETELFNKKLLNYEIYNFTYQKNIKTIAIVGSGDAAYDYALNLAKFPVKIDILQRSEEAKCLPLLQKRVEENSKINIIPKLKIQSIIEKNNKIRIEVFRRSKDEIRNYDFLFVAIGRTPSINFLSEDLKKGYKISIKSPNLFFIGDVKNKNNRQISIAMGDGVKCAMKIMENMDKKESIKPDKIIKLATLVYPSFAFLTGMQLKIFTLLEERQLPIKEIAEKLSVKPNYIERLLYSLVSAELLIVEKGLFANTKVASHFLVQGKSSYMGNHIYINPILNYWIWGSAVKTAEIIRSGNIKKFDYYSTSEEELLEMFRSTMPIAMKAGEELAKKFDFTPFKTLADVGGASGGLAISLTKANPNLKVIVTDIPVVTPVSRILLDDLGANDIDVLKWDVLEGPCSMSFDVLVLRALIQVLSPEDAKRALINIGNSVNPGGVILILGHIMDDSKISPIEEVGWYLLNLHWEDEAGYYTDIDHREMLHKAGFDVIKHEILPNGDGLVIAYKQK